MNEELTSAFDELSILQTGKATVSMHGHLRNMMNAMREGKTLTTPVMKYTNDTLIFATLKREIGEFGEWTVRLYKPKAEAISLGFKHACEQSPSVIAINTNSVSRAYMVIFGQMGLPYQYLTVAPDEGALTLLSPAEETTITPLLT